MDIKSIDSAISVSIDTLSSATSDGSRLTKETMEEFVDAIPKLRKGNHPTVKRLAKKTVQKTGKLIGRESGEAIAEKTIGNICKKIIQAIF